ncbi:Cc.Cdc5 protein [Laetiporus sulphureus 93-53]|uniref:Pre-mRNA-splicing factor CEF1 n=1 Tax=Laetiporus sulphureus 93-53 TaxID=1314785 RepID=A0A165CTZ0_9APHY|nr:Cc.Cdc5 protein [Laetiporus sulphureus 93-53]KZT03429.1 Cc.Cdc5 protein [Laetiporus sulphureus 93-53]
MVRIIIKGGVWKNTEDEVLKAAIAKYGKNQWARISSLLVRKTPKQCKARWYEWLDPSIKKTEWSKTEDEKLLHLAKLMPTQWRTIAPIVGRTATQCLERYQKLLDEAEAKENEELGLAGPGEEAGPSADDVRRLRPGEIDPDPETKPARPDPIDMDEDEKEMLSEARARLANTQGKKAKRKARERQLEEARRLAVLQKKRELKAAGIIMRHKTKKKGMDYNADIPFEKKPAPGFYDTAEEQARATTAPVGQSLRRLENKRRPDDEEAERRKRQRKANNKEGENASHQTKFVAARDAQIQKLKEAESIGRRRKLALPAAQVGEAELEDIVKIGQAGENAKALVAGGNEASARLLSDYEGLERARMARTPRTAPQHDNVMSEARNLRNMTIAQTPLLGEENTPLHTDAAGGTGFEGATPRHQVAFTPNPLATPLHPGAADGLVTPRDLQVTPGSALMRTPMRDTLSINPNDRFPSVADTPREQRMRMSSARRALKAGFMTLPKPENNFELLVPEEEEGEEQAEGGEVEEDAGDRDERLRRMREEEERKALARRSQVVQRGLPRPANVDVHQLLQDLTLEGEEPVDEAEKLVHQELAELLLHDSIAHPIPGTVHPGSTVSSYQMPPDDTVDAAKSAIREELSTALGYPDANEEQMKQGVAAVSGLEELDESASWAHVRPQLAYDASSKMWVDPAKLPEEARVAGYSALLEQCRQQMARDADKAAKTEKKLNVTLGGYQARAGALTKRIGGAFAEMQKLKVDYESFVRLRTNESATGPGRVATLKEEVEKLDRREKILQERYAELDLERRESQARVTTLEEKIMAEAEALNEAALAEMEAEVAVVA